MKAIYYLLSFIFISCNNEVRIAPEKRNNQISKLIIYNKSTNKYIADTSIIENLKIISEFDQLLNRRVKGSNFNVKNSFGYYQIKICSSDTNCQNLDLIYTVYDGVVIRYEGTYFKQDELERFIIKYAKKSYSGL